MTRTTCDLCGNEAYIIGVTIGHAKADSCLECCKMLETFVQSMPYKSSKGRDSQQQAIPPFMSRESLDFPVEWPITLAVWEKERLVYYATPEADKLDLALFISSDETAEICLQGPVTTTAIKLVLSEKNALTLYSLLKKKYAACKL